MGEWREKVRKRYEELVAAYTNKEERTVNMKGCIQALARYCDNVSEYRNLRPLQKWEVEDAFKEICTRLKAEAGERR